MRHRMPNFLYSIILLAMMQGFAAASTIPKTPDKTLSPYFFIKTDNPDVDALPLHETRAEVTIAGVIAEVRVTQVYKNAGKRPLEAIYIFPASTRAAVSSMRMQVGDRTIIARIAEREQARQEYVQARDQGKTASLLEQQRPNVFQMNVANILPGDTIRVELRYTELLVSRDGVYEFVYPTVVGPRYSEVSEASAPESEKWIANPYTHEGEKPGYRFGMRVHLAAGMPVRDVRSPSHKIDVDFDSPEDADIRLAATEQDGGNRDFILNYRLTGENVQPGLLLWQGEEENFFLLMLQPPRRIAPDLIPAREYIFIVDVSGSMNGFPLQTSKALLRELISRLRPQDRFNVLLFASSTALLAERSLPATETNIRKAIDLIDRQRGGGGTRLLPALQRALALPLSEATARSVIIATDGYVSVEKQAFELIRTSLGKANFFTFGIGSSVNRFLIEGMARAGSGEAFVITSQQEARTQAEKFREYIAAPVLTGIDVRFQGFDVYDVEPPAVPDVFAARPVLLFGKWRGQPRGTITLKGTSGAGRYSKTLDVRNYTPQPEYAALRILWARNRVKRLSDYATLRAEESLQQEILQLGLRYSLLTQYTSFVAIDSLPRNKTGKSVTVKQPLPLPVGVSDLAIGTYAASGAGAALQKHAITNYFLKPAAPMEDRGRQSFPAPEMIKRRAKKLVVIAVSPHDNQLREQIRALSSTLLACLQKSLSQLQTGQRVMLSLKSMPDGRLALKAIDGAEPPACAVALFKKQKVQTGTRVVKIILELVEEK